MRRSLLTLVGTCLVLGHASAADTEPPLIQLDLSEQTLRENVGDYAGLGCSSEQLFGATTVPSHCRRRGKKSEGLSNEDYSKTCPATIRHVVEVEVVW